MTPFTAWLQSKTAADPPPGGYFRVPSPEERLHMIYGHHEVGGSGKPIVPWGFPLAPKPQGQNLARERELLNAGFYLYDTPHHQRQLPNQPPAMTDFVGYNRPKGPHFLYERHAIGANKPYQGAVGAGTPAAAGLAAQKPWPFAGEVPGAAKPMAAPPAPPPAAPMPRPVVPGIPKIGREYTPGEDCPHCHACLERNEEGYCNTCGKPWPEKKADEFDAGVGKPIAPGGSQRQSSTMTYQVPGSDRKTVAQLLGSGPTTDVIASNKPLRTGLNRYSDLPPLQPNELNAAKPFDGMDVPPPGAEAVPDEPFTTGMPTETTGGMPTETTGLAKWWPYALGGLGAIGAGGLGAYYLNRKKKKQLGEEEDGGEEKQAQDDEAAAKAKAQMSFLPHVRAGAYHCTKCGSRNYTEAAAKRCCGTEVVTARSAKKADCGPLVKKTDKAESKTGMYHCLECGNVHYTMGDAEKCCGKGVVLERKKANDPSAGSAKALVPGGFPWSGDELGFATLGMRGYRPYVNRASSGTGANFNVLTAFNGSADDPRVTYTLLGNTKRPPADGPTGDAKPPMPGGERKSVPTQEVAADKPAPEGTLPGADVSTEMPNELQFKPTWLMRNAIPLLTAGGLGAGGVLAHRLWRKNREAETRDKAAGIKELLAGRQPYGVRASGGEGKPFKTEMTSPVLNPVTGKPMGSRQPAVDFDRLIGTKPGAGADARVKDTPDGLVSEGKAAPPENYEAGTDMNPPAPSWLANNWPYVAGAGGLAGLGLGAAYLLRRRRRRAEEEGEKRSDWLGEAYQANRDAALNWWHHAPEAQKQQVVGDLAANAFITTPGRAGLGALIGVARSPKGYTLTSAARGAGYGTAAGLGAGAGTLLHNLAGNPEDLGPRLALQLGGAGLGLLTATNLMGEHPGDVEAKRQAKYERDLAAARARMGVPSEGVKTSGDARIPVTAPKTMKPAPIPAAPLPQQPVPPVSPLPGDVAKTTLSVSPQPVNTATAAPAGGSTKKGGIFDPGGFLDRNIGQPVSGAYNSITTGAGANAAKGFMGQLGLGGAGDAAGGSFLDRNPWARIGLIGAPIGAGLGLVGGLLNRKKKKNALGDALTGGLLGAGAGALAGGIPMLFGGKGEAPTTKTTPPVPVETVPTPPELPARAAAPETPADIFTRTPADIAADKNLLESYRIGNQVAPVDPAAATKLRALAAAGQDPAAAKATALDLAEHVATKDPALGPAMSAAGGGGIFGHPAFNQQGPAAALADRVGREGVVAPGGGNVFTGVGGQSAMEAAGTIGAARGLGRIVAMARGQNPTVAALKGIDNAGGYQPGWFARQVGLKPVTAEAAREKFLTDPNVAARVTSVLNAKTPGTPMTLDDVAAELRAGPGRSATVNQAMTDLTNAGGKVNPRVIMDAVAADQRVFADLASRVRAAAGVTAANDPAAVDRAIMAQLRGQMPMSAGVARELERLSPGVSFTGRTPAMVNLAVKPGLLGTVRRGLFGGHSPINPINLGLGAAVGGGRQYFMGNPARTIGEAAVGRNLSPAGLYDAAGRLVPPAAPAPIFSAGK